MHSDRLTLPSDGGHAAASELVGAPWAPTTFSGVYSRGRVPIPAPAGADDMPADEYAVPDGWGPETPSEYGPAAAYLPH